MASDSTSSAVPLTAKEFKPILDERVKQLEAKRKEDETRIKKEQDEYCRRIMKDFNKDMKNGINISRYSRLDAIKYKGCFDTIRDLGYSYLLIGNKLHVSTEHQYYDSGDG